MPTSPTPVNLCLLSLKITHLDFIKVSMDKQSSHDYLSDLPLGIIHTILERLPIKDAGRTCILSRQWRYNCASLPRLSFSRSRARCSEAELKDLINQIFLLHQGPILKFKLHIEDWTIAKNLDSWLTFLSRNGIRELFLHHFDEVRVALSSLYSCQDLTHLAISDGYIPPPPPTFNGFMCLTCLKLDSVDVPSEALQSLLSNLNLLEELRLVDCGRELELKIHVPNLKTIYLSGYLKDIRLYAPFVRAMFIEIRRHEAPRPSFVFNNDSELLGGLSTLEELKGGLNFFKFLSTGIESRRTPLMFPRLRFIALSPDAFYDKKIESFLAILCKGAPNLHKIGIWYTLSYPSSLDTECPFNFTFEQLKVIEFGYPYFVTTSGGYSRLMKLIKCLLARTPALETLVCVRPGLSDRKLGDGELLELTSTLLTYPRVSPNAKVIFKSR